MRILIALTFVCLVLSSVQAGENWDMLRNYLKRVFKDTHVNSKGSISANKDGPGFKFQYGAGLSYGSGKHKFDLFDFGLDFGVEPEVHNFNLTLQNSTFRYNGNLVLNGDTNVTISGQAGIANTIDATYDEKKQTAAISVQQSFTDSNSFIARNATTVTTSRNTVSLNLNHSISQLRDTFKSQHSGAWNLQARGTVTNGTTSLGAFTLINTANATSNQTLVFFPKQLSRGRIQLGRGCNKKKTENVGAFSGKTEFKVANSFNFMNDLNTTSLNGTAKNDGYIGVRDDDVIVQGSATYNTIRSDSTNGTVLNTTSAYGVADTVTIFRNSSIPNGSSFNVTQSGKLVQQLATTMNTGPKPKTVKSLMKAGWAASSVTTNEATSDNSNNVNTTKSFEYTTKTYNNINNYLRDCDDRKNKPVITQGNPTLTAAFKTNTTSSSLQDLQFKLYDNNRKYIDVDAQLNDD